MRIAVCIKQVPIVSALQFDPHTKTLKREGVPTEVSSFDVRALIKAVELAAAHGGEVIVVTMGPPQARDALAHCLALGANRAIHLCDRAFAGSDTLATARALALALHRESLDLILCGRNSVDAETGQVGPEVAELLDLPQITGARTLSVDPSTHSLTAERETDDGFETICAPLPALVTAAEDLAPERFPSKAEREAAKTKPCIEVPAAELSPDPSQLGAAGSPTAVAALQHIETTRQGRIIEAGSIADAAARLARILIDDHGLFGTWKVHEQPAIAEMAASRRRVGPQGIFVLAETLAGTIRPVAFELLGKAAALAGALGTRVTALLFGPEMERYAAELAAYGADRVLLADHPQLAPYRTEMHAAALAAAIQSHVPRIVLIPATTMGRDLAPRVAARLQLGLTGDCIDIGLDAQGRLLQYKPAFGGSVVAPILSRTFPEMATVRPGILPLPTPDASRRATIERLPVHALPPARTRIVEQRGGAAAAADLDRAEIVIGVGMGLGDRTHLARIEPLAKLLGAGLCTTRDVTDAGWLPKQYQVGLTGRAIAPQLYIAIGIRGAFEHTVGVRRAGLIVAINKNAKALIFKHADYGIVGDYAEVVPALHRHLSAARR
ncbi:MAG TPA: FAD-binding protein [Candidatus Acidoferrales bacterium]|nr:FAD-binding protein [Candidatus Acidoferrales bacterium]